MGITAGLQFILDIGNGLFFFTLHIIDLGNIIRYYSSVFFFIFHHPERFQRIPVLPVFKGKETVIIICRQIIGIIPLLPDSIEKGLGSRKPLQGKIGISLVKFHIRNLPVTQIGNIGLLKTIGRLPEIFIAVIKFCQVKIHHLYPGIIFFHFNILQGLVF